MQITTVKVLEVINVNGGAVKLSKSQHSSRAHNLSLVEDGIFNVINKVQFKIGEVVGIEAPISRYLRQRVNVIDGDVEEDVIQNINTKNKDETGEGGPSDSNEPTEFDSEKIALLVNGIAMLDPDEDDHWTKTDGLPSIKALKEITNIDEIEASERDEAYKDYMTEQESED